MPRVCLSVTYKTSPGGGAVVGEGHIADPHIVHNPEDGQVVLDHVAAFKADQGGGLALAMGPPDI